MTNHKYQRPDAAEFVKATQEAIQRIVKVTMPNSPLEALANAAALKLLSTAAMSLMPSDEHRQDVVSMALAQAMAMGIVSEMLGQDDDEQAEA